MFVKKLNNFFLNILHPNWLSMFKKEFTYGEILLYLYNNPGYRQGGVKIKKGISHCTDEHFLEVIGWLLKDELIIREYILLADRHPNELSTVFRLSYKGFAFINDLTEKRKSRFISTGAIIATCIGILIPTLLQTCNGVTKVEITKYPLSPNENAIIRKGNK